MLSKSTLKAMRGALFMRLQSVSEQHTEQNILMYESTKQALAEVDNLLAGDSIASIWSVDDVYSLDSENYDDDGNYTGDITLEQARAVLHLCESEHDASVGINWDVMREWLNYVQGEVVVL